MKIATLYRSDSLVLALGHCCPPILPVPSGIASPPLALWDVDGDSMQDMILGVTEETNDTHPTQGNKGVRETL